MLPKAETPEDIKKLETLLKKEEKEKKIAKKIMIVPLIESTNGVINVHQISNVSSRVAALGFGAGDFMREIGEGFTITQMTPDEYFPLLLYARSRISTAACAVGIPAIDTPYFGLLIDKAGLEREASKAKLLGFKGKMVTHPRHIDTVNRIFSPSEKDVEFSKKMVSAYKEAEAEGKGATVLDGKMIDIAMYNMGMDLIRKAEGIKKKMKIRGNKEAQTLWIPGNIN
jgi:citrate lyase subunit beta/citryl-CoA lyase